MKTKHFLLSILICLIAICSSQENIVLVKNDTVKMGDYFVSWVDKRQEGINQVYQID